METIASRKNAVEFDRQTPPQIARGNIENPAIPPDTRLRIRAPQRFRAVGIHALCIDKRQLHRPVMRQVTACHELSLKLAVAGAASRPCLA